jgi:hypothetical protein
MIWLLYSDYLKESLKTATYMKFLKWYVWVIFSVLMLIDVGLFFAFIVNDIIWLQWVMFIIAALAGLYFGNEIRKVIYNRVGTHEEVYNRNVIILRGILVRRSLHSREQVDLLIEQIDEELPKLKTSDSLLKPIYTFSTIVFIPIITLLVKWILDKHSNEVYLVILIVLIAVMVFSLYYMVKPLLEELLDLEYKRMTKLKQMIQDIRVIDLSQ